MKTLRLGLIGGNITQSRSPALQIICALSAGGNASYDLLIPDEQGLSFAEMLARCGRAGFDGVNVTYPYKEEALKLVAPAADSVRALGAANTVKFSPDGARAYNTDHTGFLAAWRAKWGDRKPGRVVIIGAGGAGRAIAFALAELGAEELLLQDIDAAKAGALAAALKDYCGAQVTLVAGNPFSEIEDADGLVNCTPLGMHGRPGSPLSGIVSGAPKWAFDAVYTPENTLFRAQCEAMGADFMSGYELYFHQGVQGFRIFSGGIAADEEWVRNVLKGRSQLTA